MSRGQIRRAKHRRMKLEIKHKPNGDHRISEDRRAALLGSVKREVSGGEEEIRTETE